jgi:hypothetical protein
MKFRKLQGEVNDSYMKADRADQFCRQMEVELQNTREKVFSSMIEVEEEITE